MTATAKRLSQSNVLTFGDGPGLKVSLDKFIVSRGLIQANSGGGKSHLIRAILEQTHGRIPQHVLDPEGEFSSLRERFDYVLAAKAGGDVEASIRTAALLCRRLMELGASVIVDLYELGKDERREFIRRYVTEMMNLPRSLWRPTLVVVDEAHEACPERGQGEAVSTEAVIDLCSRGRKRGYAALLATQRISKLHKDAAAELLNKWVGRTGLDVDLDRAAKELGFDKERRATLKNLSPGDFYSYGPAISNEVILVRGPDVVTAHPKAGQLAAAPPPPSAKVRSMLAQQLADLPKESEDRERSMESLERECRSLQAKLAIALKAQPQPPAPAKAEKIEIPALREADVARVERAVAAADRMGERATQATNALIDATKKLTGALETAKAAAAKAESAFRGVGFAVGEKTHLRSIPAREPLQAPRRSPPPAAAEIQTSGQPLKKGAREMLRLLVAAHHQLGRDLTRRELATLAGMRQSGSFSDYLGRLRSMGLVDYGVNGDPSATAEGQAAVKEPGRVPTVDHVLARWQPHLKAGARRMLEVLVEAHPNGLARQDLAAAVAMEQSGSFSDYLGRLRSSGLVDGLKASDAVFLGGR